MENTENPVNLSIQRRKFLQKLGIIVGVTTLTDSLIACNTATVNTPSIQPITTNTPKPNTAPVTTLVAKTVITSDGFNLVGLVDQFKVNEDPSAFTIKGKLGFVYNQAGELYVFSGACTHQGCEVEYFKRPQRFICPCHSSEFDQKGEVVKGPATLRLTKLEFKIVQNQLFVKIA